MTAERGRDSRRPSSSAHSERTSEQPTARPTPQANHGTQEVRASTLSTAAPSGAPSLPERFGRYRILKKLGQGGMGSVYLAHDSQLDRRLALKVPLFTEADGPETLQRFYREARSAATLAHPNICPVHDVGTIDGIHYVTMDYIEGKPLSELIGSTKRLPQKAVAAVVRKLALAMQEAHQKGIIHRDLKPANVMINQRNEPVIMDFGLARRAQEDVRLTKSGSILGTPAYMAPEQVGGDVKAIGPGCDIYSLGVILFEMLTGQLPFSGPVTAVLGQILTQEPPRPASLRPDLDPALEAICLKAMAKKQSDRYGSMRDLAAALTAYLKGESAARAAAAPARPQPVAEVVPVVEPAPPAPEGLATHLLAKLANRLEADAETIRESQKLAAHQHRAARWPMFLAALVILGAIFAVAYVAVGNKPAGPAAPPVVNLKNDVTVQLALPREVTDPTVVLILVDGTPRTKEELASPLSLAAGDHVLEIKRKDGKIVKSTFTVGQDSDQKTVAVPPPKEVPPAVAAGGNPGTPPKPPAAGEWVSLFNGKDLGDWSIYPSGTAGWKVEDGVLVGSGPDSVLFSPRGGYKNFHFRVEAMVSDGGWGGQLFRSNFRTGRPAAYYALINSTSRASYKTGSLVGTSGGSYAVVNDDLVKPDTWFTQEVIADKNHLTVLVNGKTVVDLNDAAKDHMQGFLALQKVGKDAVIKFRKVEVKELPPYRPDPRPDSGKGWVSLFNGTDIEGWKTPAGSAAGWKVEDGALVGSGPEGLLFTPRGDYKNFRLRVEAQVNDGGAGAVVFRAALRTGNPPGYHTLINSTSNQYPTGSIIGQSGGSYAVVSDPFVKPDTWFTLEILANGTNLAVSIDGDEVVNFIDQGNEFKEGHIALKKFGKDTVIKFRRIEIQELPAPK
jgi:predicted Ser/Thr protein kinase